MADPAASDIIKVTMDEFKALRDEINQRATYCHTLININVVASGALAGLVLGGTPNRADLIIFMPILNAVLGLLWLDHSYSISNMGHYIGRELKPVVSRVLGVDLLRWEIYLDERVKGQTWLRWLPLGAPVLVMFGLVPLFALAASVGEVQTSAKLAIWVVGLLLTLAFLILWLSLLFSPYVQGRRSQ